MAYESTKVVKTLRFPGDTNNQYAINAVRLDGHTYNEIDERFKTLENFDALRYMGTIAGSSTAPGGLTVAANKGDVYKVTAKGYVMGAKVEVGDMLICNADNTVAATQSNYNQIAQYWDIVQTNVDVEAILAHYHTGDVTFTRSNKVVSHTVTPSKTTITASFNNGTASVNGQHNHNASGSVTVTPQGSVANAEITPAGTITLSSPDSKGSKDVTLTPKGTVNATDKKYITSVTVNDHAAHKHTGKTDTTNASVTGTVTISTGSGAANYTPAGTVNNSNGAVTNVEAGNTSVSSHTVSSVSNAGGHTPSGKITINSITPVGSVATHNHSVSVDASKSTHSAIGSITSTYTAGDTDYDGILTIGTTASNVTYVTGVTVSEQSVAPAFTGTSVTPTGTFKGDVVAAHSHTVNIADHDEFVPVISVTKGEHNHTFAGTGVQLVATPNLTSNHKHDFTTDDAAAMSHSVNAPVETAAHTHTFTGTDMYVHAAFEGAKASHNHTFTGTESTHSVTVNVNDFTGNFSGTAAGNVAVTNGKDVLTGITITEHTISTVDSGSFTTGEGKQN